MLTKPLHSNILLFFLPALACKRCDTFSIGSVTCNAEGALTCGKLSGVQQYLTSNKNCVSAEACPASTWANSGELSLALRASAELASELGLPRCLTLTTAPSSQPTTLVLHVMKAPRHVLVMVLAKRQLGTSISPQSQLPTMWKLTNVTLDPPAASPLLPGMRTISTPPQTLAVRLVQSPSSLIRVSCRLLISLVTQY